MLMILGCRTAMAASQANLRARRTSRGARQPAALLSRPPCALAGAALASGPPAWLTGRFEWARAPRTCTLTVPS